MTEKVNSIEDYISSQLSVLGDNSDERYVKLGIKFNPFPRSGAANINSSDFVNGILVPINPDVKKEIFDFITHGLNDNYLNPKDKFISATITGDYGSGKTQLLMFVKYILGVVSTFQKSNKNPYVIYIDNPGVKLLDLIGSIISKVGEENFKKFIWGKIISRITQSDEFKDRLSSFVNVNSMLFPGMDINPYSESNSVSYKKFLSAIISNLTTSRQKKRFEGVFKEILLEILQLEVGDSILAQYFYQLLSEDYGVNKTWEALSSGNIKQLNRKEAGIIKYIVKLVKEQGFTDFFILVDEFEDITEGRLSKAQVDNYIYNLRTLIDEHREWCLLFAMTGQALKKLKSVSPPLADRITARRIILQNLTNEEAQEVVTNYLDMAREEPQNKVFPFHESGINALNHKADGNARKFLKNCYYLLEKFSEENKEGTIDEEYVKQNLREREV